MIHVDLNKVAATLWFFFGAFAFCGFLTVDAFTTQIVSAIEDLRYWVWTAVTTSGVATMSGLVVDLARFVASNEQTHKEPYNVTLKKNLNRRLA